MEKQGKKPNNWIIFAVAAIALLSLAAFAYAQEFQKGHISNNNMMDMMGGKGMDQMHKQMTKNLNPETREQMDKVHGQCEKLHEEKSFKEGMMQ